MYELDLLGMLCISENGCCHVIKLVVDSIRISKMAQQKSVGCAFSQKAGT